MISSAYYHWTDMWYYLLFERELTSTIFWNSFKFYIYTIYLLPIGVINTGCLPLRRSVGNNNNFLVYNDSQR